jgi:hypothetical protein
MQVIMTAASTKVSTESTHPLAVGPDVDLLPPLAPEIEPVAKSLELSHEHRKVRDLGFALYGAHLVIESWTPGRGYRRLERE